MSVNAMGIIFSNIHDEKFNELTANDTLGAIPFGAKYRLIDFSLSNMHNSEITNVGIIAKNHYQSLINHIGAGEEWDLARKKNGLFIFPPFCQTPSGYYRNKIDALYGISSYLKKSKCDYVLLSDCNVICNLDWRKPLDYHISKKADITFIYYTQMTDHDHNYETIYELSDDGYVNHIRINSKITDSTAIGTNMYIIGRSLLISLIEDAMVYHYDCLESGIFNQWAKQYRIAAWEHQGYIRLLNSIEDYFKANLDIINPTIRKDLFSKYGNIYTKTTDEVPTKYGNLAEVSNSIIGDGCLIEGSVENSILFNGVTVGKGTKISNCVLMKNCRTGDHVDLSYVLVDKNVSFGNNLVLSGYEKPLYVRKDSVV